MVKRPPSEVQLRAEVARQMKIKAERHLGAIIRKLGSPLHYLIVHPVPGKDAYRIAPYDLAHEEQGDGSHELPNNVMLRDYICVRLGGGES